MKCMFSIILDSGEEKIVLGDVPSEVIDDCLEEHDYLNGMEEGIVLAGMMSMFANYLDQQTRKAARSKRHR